MRVSRQGVPEPEARLVARDTLEALVATVIEMPRDRQRGLLIRVDVPGHIEEYDDRGIRELAARSDGDGAGRTEIGILPTRLSLGDWRA
ncbi:hypothetical protein NX02_01385 [Sphingomonas sanxanigenens DSM 19645 = NX02]|uniref:Uncharacterized protein n=2 Tax=Sphingomonas sanxanigenens TaxID=397260 RepID=W0A6U8_9SPHN|nr:hypothetical protein NX02_01385 [Sphingomonas sanxanigenens DSM 19645 = NX02]